jgi:UDP-N-acetylmuramoylalanine--D-glutamate ligase
MDAVRDVGGKRVLVMGLGRFGGGIGVTRWLVEQGARVTVTDLAETGALAASVAQLDGLGVRLRLGGHDEADLAGVDLLVVSPAVDKGKSAFFQAAVQRGIPWTTEMNLFFERCDRQIVGVTGSAGKSTTTAMIGEVLRAGFAHLDDPPRVWVGGNIGRSLLSELPNMRRDDVVVLELSSFQLEDLAAVRAGCTHAVITNLRPNHLDRHGTEAAYYDAKMNIVRFLREHGTIAYNADDEILARLLNEVRPVQPDAGRKRRISARDRTAWVHVADGAIRVYREATELAAGVAPADRVGAFETLTPVGELGVPGAHNVYNAMLAVTVGLLYGATNEAMASALRGFAGLAHRLEFVAEVGGVRYYNDSKSTTPDSAIRAVEAFDVPGVAIVGGYDKGSSFDELARVLAGRARAVICLGATGPAIAAAVRGASGGRGPMVREVDTFDGAVAAAREAAEAGDVVLLSPACASWGMFTNYEERGERFKGMVEGWRKRRSDGAT